MFVSKMIEDDSWERIPRFYYSTPIFQSELYGTLENSFDGITHRIEKWRLLSLHSFSAKQKQF